MKPLVPLLRNLQPRTGHSPVAVGRRTSGGDLLGARKGC